MYYYTYVSTKYLYYLLGFTCGSARHNTRLTYYRYLFVAFVRVIVRVVRFHKTYRKLRTAAYHRFTLGFTLCPHLTLRHRYLSNFFISKMVSRYLVTL